MCSNCKQFSSCINVSLIYHAASMNHKMSTLIERPKFAMRKGFVEVCVTGKWLSRLL